MYAWLRAGPFGWSGDVVPGVDEPDAVMPDRDEVEAYLEFAVHWQSWRCGLFFAPLPEEAFR